jgi:uncharacterized membrane protein YdjX (TVP38/TMEM64 family)
MTVAGVSLHVKHLAWLALATIVLVTIAAWSLLPIEDWISDFTMWIETLGAWAFIAFGLLYILGTLLLAPGSVMSIAAGVAFGVWGVPLVLSFATAGAAAAFLIARYVARETVEQTLERHPNFKAIGKAIDEEGWKVVGLLRLSPPVPFAVTNYFFGLTNVGFLPFVITTLLGIVPATLVYVNIGAMGHAAGTGKDGGELRWFLLGVGVIATIVAGVLVTRKAKEKLRAAGEPT